MTSLPTPLPTDNFYKFGTILGIVIFVVSLYLWGTLQSSIAAKADAVIQASAATSKPIETTDDPRLEPFYRVSNSNVKVFGAAAAIGLIASGWSARHWYTKHQTLQDELLRLDVEAARLKAKELLK